MISRVDLPVIVVVFVFAVVVVVIVVIVVAGPWYVCMRQHGAPGTGIRGEIIAKSASRHLKRSA